MSALVAVVCDTRVPCVLWCVQHVCDYNICYGFMASFIQVCHFCLHFCDNFYRLRG